MTSINIYSFFFNSSNANSDLGSNPPKHEKLCEACGTQIDYEKRNCPECGALQIGMLYNY